MIMDCCIEFDDLALTSVNIDLAHESGIPATAGFLLSYLDLLVIPIQS